MSSPLFERMDDARAQRDRLTAQPLRVAAAFVDLARYKGLERGLKIFRAIDAPAHRYMEWDSEKREYRGMTSRELAALVDHTYSPHAIGAVLSHVPSWEKCGKRKGAQLWRPASSYTYALMSA